MRAFVFALLLTNLARAVPFRSSDGAFEFDAPKGTQDLSQKMPAGTMSLMTPDKVLIMGTVSKPMKVQPEKFLAAVKRHSAWTVVDTHMGKLGGRPAAIYCAETEMKVQGYKTITAVILGPSQTYNFKIHYPRGQASRYEAWFKKLKWLK